MPIALDGTVTSFEYSTSSASHTVSNNSDRLLIVSYGTYQGSGPSAIKWNGADLTKLVEQVGSFGEQCSIWGLIAPEVGTFTLAITGMGNWSAAGIYSLYNCDQTLPATTATNGGDSNSQSVTITTLVDNSWVIASMEAEPVITLTTSGGTEDYNFEGASFQHQQGQRIAKATAGSQSMTNSLSYGARWNSCAVEVEEVVATTPTFIPTISII